METLSEIDSRAASLAAYDVISPGVSAALKDRARPLRGLRVVHVNSTATGGGVAELLRSHVALENELGLRSRWLVMTAEPDFFRITKKIHNLLQGARHIVLSEAEKRLYEDTGRATGIALAKIFSSAPADIVVIHDPQPLWAIDALDSVTALLRIHVDLSTPDPDTLQFLKGVIERYKGAIFSHDSFVPSWMKDGVRARIIMPAIDPFSDKNKEVADAGARAASLGIDLGSPAVIQVSRFDQWKDPIGVVEAYRLAKKDVPDLQLILAGSYASDDPEAEAIFEEVRRFVGSDPAVFFYTQSNDVMVNAIRSVSSVVLQKSIREGFGLTVTEAMWKEKAVVGGDAAGIRAQIKDGENGFVVSSPADAARAIVQLIKDPALCRIIGKNARRTVVERFLMPRYIEEHLAFYADMAF